MKHNSTSGKKAIAYILGALIILTISIFNSTFFLLIIPLVLLLCFDLDLKPKRYLLILFFLFSAISAFLNQNAVSGSHNSNMLTSTSDFLLSIYNTAKYNIIETEMGNIKTMREPYAIDDFEYSNLTNFYIPQDGTFNVSLDGREHYTGNSSLKLAFSPGLQISVIRMLSKASWNDYNYANLWVKGDSVGGMLEFIIIDADGDWWHYYDNTILQKSNWTLLKMPLKSFNNPSWTRHGNRKQNFDTVTGYAIKISAVKKEPGNHSVYFDSIYLSDI
jgi:hypothetical protein